MHLLGKENKRADFPKIFDKFPKIRDQTELNREREDSRKKKNCGCDSFDDLQLHLQYE